MTVTYEPMNIMTSGNERAGEYMCECVCVCAYGCVCVCVCVMHKSTYIS